MRAVKGNRSYTITENDKEYYRKQGFDIIGEDGQVLEHGAGKTVPYEEYAKVLAENKKLKEKLSEVAEGEVPCKNQEPVPLVKLKKEDLKSLANELGIDVPSKATVEELVTLIEAKQAEAKE